MLPDPFSVSDFTQGVDFIILMIGLSTTFKKIMVMNFSNILFSRCIVFTAFIACLGLVIPVHAQDAGNVIPKVFKTKARAADATTLKAGSNLIALWGVKAVDGVGPGFGFEGRVALDSLITGKNVQCETKGHSALRIVAQCETPEGIDLGLAVVEKGFATLDHASIFGSPFESSYLQAEQIAQDKGVGVWGDQDGTGQSEEQGFLITLNFVLFGLLLAVFGGLAIYMMRGFRRVSDAQEANTEMLERERALKDKEREIFAMMLDSEVKANKSKIEAYIVVYEEMMRALKDPEKTPSYKKAGDLVQVQPALDRAVFDQNTDKLDIVGERLSSEVVHFYARIKTKPDYVDLHPDMAIEDAQAIVDKALSSGRRLSKIADRLIDLFAQGGYASKDYQMDGDSFDDI